VPGFLCRYGGCCLLKLNNAGLKSRRLFCTSYGGFVFLWEKMRHKKGGDNELIKLRNEV
jgi:hypothetical protein